MRITKEELERVTHLNSVMSEIYDLVDDTSESLFDKDKEGCEETLDKLIPILIELRESIDHEIK